MPPCTDGADGSNRRNPAVALQKVVSGGLWHGATPGNPAADVKPVHNIIKLLCPNETVRLSISPAC